MRMTVIKGVEDDWKETLYGDPLLVAGVLERGRARSALVFEAELTGEETLALLRETYYPHALDDKIVNDHHYILTAFDD